MLERIAEKFNIAEFKSGFNVALSKYASAADTLQNPYLNSVDEVGKENYSPEEIRSLELDKMDGMEQMIAITTKALKLSDRKQEVLDSISSSFLAMNIQESPPYESNQFTDTFSELKFMKKVILELMK